MCGAASKTGDVAQLVEHLLCKQGVVGSIPSISTSLVERCWRKPAGDAVTGIIEFRFFAAQFL